MYGFDNFIVRDGSGLSLRQLDTLQATFNPIKDIIVMVALPTMIAFVIPHFVGTYIY